MREGVLRELDSACRVGDGHPWAWRGNDAEPAERLGHAKEFGLI